MSVEKITTFLGIVHRTLQIIVKHPLFLLQIGFFFFLTIFFLLHDQLNLLHSHSTTYHHVQCLSINEDCHACMVCPNHDGVHQWMDHERTCCEFGLLEIKIVLYSVIKLCKPHFFLPLFHNPKIKLFKSEDT